MLAVNTIDLDKDGGPFPPKLSGLILCLFSREERELWIRAKYEQRAFVAALQLAPRPQLPEGSMPAWLLSAVIDRDLPRLLLLLAHSTKDQINAQPAGSTSPCHTALHAACQLGDVVMTQLLIWVGLTSLSLYSPACVCCQLLS